MQRYRVNYKLLVSVFVGGVVLVVGSFVLWRYQVSRKATVFRENAQIARDEGRTTDAFSELLKYVQLRRDEVEPRLELSRIAIDLINDTNTNQELRGQAFAFLEETVRRTGDPELTREFVKIIIGFRPQDALPHLDELLRDNPDDSELLALRAQALYRVKGLKAALEMCFKLVGYDRLEGEFDPAAAKVKDRPEVYSLLSALIIENDKDDQPLAEKVIDQMVEVNPDSAVAHLNRAVFLRTIDKKDEANTALEKAHEIDPDNVDVLQQIGAVAFEDKEYDKAEAIFREGIKNKPDRLILYDLLSRALIQQEKFDEALATLDQGIKQIGPDRSLYFARTKINIFFSREDFANVEKELDKLVKLNKPALEPFINFTRARTIWQQQKWTEAAQLLAPLRARLIDYPQEQAMAGVLLGSSYERQGKYDLAKQAYTEVVEKHPTYEAAKLALDNLRSRVNPQGDKAAIELDEAINAMAELPEHLQDWSKIDAMVAKIAEDREFSEGRLKLVQANVMIKRKKFEEAKALIREANELEPDNVGVRYAAVSLLSIDPNAGPEKAMALLDKMEEQLGDSLRIRITRANLLRAANDGDVGDKLANLVKGTEAWDATERAELLRTIAAQFEQLGDSDRASDYLKQAIEIIPDSLPARTRLFEIAFQQRDVEAMMEAEKSILDLVKNPNDGTYIYCVVRRMMWQYSQQDLMREELASARAMLDTALQSRSQWAELHVLYGQLLLLLEEDQELALRHLNDALRYGPPNPSALALQVKLLGQRNNIAEARSKVDLIPESMRQQLLGRAYAEVLTLSGDKQLGYEAARELAELEPENATTQVWFARFANDVDKPKEAISALKKATELAPADPDVWMQLLGVQAAAKDAQGVEETLRRAQLAVDGDFLALLTARKYELMGDWRAGEKIYLANYADRLDEPAIAQRLAEFYLLWAQQGKVSAERAAPYINRILKQAYEGKLEKTNPVVAWARDKAARLLAATGDYQQAVKAQKLLGIDGDLKSLALSEKILLAEILASRNEPEAQLQAIKLLSSMDDDGTITREGVLALARLLSKAGNWSRSEKLMLGAITKFPKDEQVRSTFVNLLIEQGDFAQASRQLAALRELNPKSTGYISLSIKLAARTGNRSKLTEMLTSLIPENLQGAMTSEQLGNVLMVARLAAEHNEHELAGTLYGLYVTRASDANLEYMNYLATHGDPEMAMQLLEKTFSQSMDEVLQIAAAMLRTRRGEIGNSYDARVDALVAAALRDDPESVRRMLIQAEILEIQGKYAESVAKYDAVLRRNDVPRLTRAAAMNNLGFLLTLLNERTEEAEQLINEAMEVYGPVSDILDTRAVVRMTRKEYDQAVEDMSLATSLSNDPVKFYHYAQANLLAGNDQAALKAWDKAQKLGIAKEKLPVLEQKNFDQVKTQIENLRTQNAQL